jgi:excisionase family DNA binding protein
VPRVPSDWITLAEAAELFRAANVTVTTSTLARWVAAGRLQSIRPGRRIYVRRAQVRALLTPRRPSVRLDDQPGLFELVDSGVKGGSREA